MTALTVHEWNAGPRFADNEKEQSKLMGKEGHQKVVLIFVNISMVPLVIDFWVSISL